VETGSEMTRRVVVVVVVVLRVEVVKDLVAIAYVSIALLTLSKDYSYWFLQQ
jgi:hypothetical protein